MEKKLDLCVEPAAFFQERISEVMTRQKFATIEVAEYYVVDLLARFMLASNLFDKQPQEENGLVDRDPLAVMLLKAQTSGVETGERVRTLKRLGDTSLYISGFFGDSLNRKVIDLDYYREMGCIAYRSLAEAVKDDQFQELYTELSGKFSGFVDVLTEVSQETFVQNNQNLLRLYDMYVRTGSELAKKKLESNGLPMALVIQNNSDKNLRADDDTGDTTLFGLGFGELLLLSAIGLIVLGPKQMPQVARVLGRTIAELRKALHEVTSSIKLDDETKKNFSMNHENPPQKPTPPEAVKKADSQPEDSKKESS